MDELAGLTDYWPLLALAVVLGALGVTAKATLWQSPSWWGRWGRLTMPAHPVVLGALVAMIPGCPVALGGDSIVAHALGGALAGVLSTWIYDVAKRRLERL